MRRVFPFLVLLIAASPGCGKKGPPLAPLNMAPEAPRAATARRLGNTVYLQLIVPDKSMTGRGAYSVDHINVYAMTVAPGTPVPANRDFLTPDHVIGQISVQPPPDPDAAEPETPDTRPKPGDTVTFVEKLTDAQFVAEAPPKPKSNAKPEAAASTKGTSRGRAAGAEAPAASTNAAPAPVGPAVLSRIYVLQGVPKGSSKGGLPSPRLEVPMLQPPNPPRDGLVSHNETAVGLSWQPPASSTDEVPGVTYNVYAVPPHDNAPAAAAGTAATDHPVAPTPLNAQPIAGTAMEHPGAEPGKEQCFIVRSVATVGTASIESDPSSPICITPKDTFPPAAPKGLAAVASAGAINLIWDANTEADLAGYIILRGETPGDTLQPLMREPLKETRFTDRTAQPNVRYVYQVIAVDKAGNRSAPSNRVEEAAR